MKGKRESEREKKRYMVKPNQKCARVMMQAKKKGVGEHHKNNRAKARSKRDDSLRILKKCKIMLQEGAESRMIKRVTVVRVVVAMMYITSAMLVHENQDVESKEIRGVTCVGLKMRRYRPFFQLDGRTA